MPDIQATAEKTDENVVVVASLNDITITLVAPNDAAGEDVELLANNFPQAATTALAALVAASESLDE